MSSNAQKGTQERKDAAKAARAQQAAIMATAKCARCGKAYTGRVQICLAGRYRRSCSLYKTTEPTSDTKPSTDTAAAEPR